MRRAGRCYRRSGTRLGFELVCTLAVGLYLGTPARASVLVMPTDMPVGPGAAMPLLSVSADGSRATTPGGVSSSAESSENARRRAIEWRVPLAFEATDAGAPEDADFMARGPGYAVYVGPGGAILSLQSRRSVDDSSTSRRGKSTAGRRSDDPGDARPWIRMRFVGAAPNTRARADSVLPGRIHRIQGSDPSRWRSGLRAHGRVVYREVYRGIDVAYYGRGRELEYDLVVAPGADAGRASLGFDGVRGKRLDGNGDLILETSAGSVVQRRPVAYQAGREGRERVEASYRIDEDGTVGFELGEYDRERELVIDPVLSYATYLGGTGLDQCWDIAVDAEGHAVVVGETESTAFSGVRIASTNVLQGQYGGGIPSVAGDAFVARLAPDGTAFEWFTYLGGSGFDGAYSLAMATGGEPVLAGFTSSTNFPVTSSAFRTAISGTTNRFTGRKPLDGFVTRLRADGSGLVSSTYYGGDDEDQIIDLALTTEDAVVVVGSTTSSNLVRTTGGGLASEGIRDGFFALLSSDLGRVTQARYLGGTGRDSLEGVALSVDGAIAHVVGITESTNYPVVAPVQGALAGGFDTVLAGLRLADGGIAYSTYFGGGQDDYGYRLASGADGKVWMAGVTFSTDFPVVAPVAGSTNAGLSDAILVRIAEDGKNVEMSSYFGGFLDDAFWDVRIDGAGRIHLAGETFSASLPGLTTNNVFGPSLGLSDVLIVRVTPDGVPQTSLVGAPGDELAYAIAADPAGNAYVAGRVRSVAFPVTSTNVAQPVFGGNRTDGFVLKLVHEPVLTAVPVGEGLILSWPAPNSDFVLESAPAALTTEGWRREASAVTMSGGRHSVRLPMSATNSVFRLRWAAD